MLDLHGEMDGSAEETLNAAYAEAKALQPQRIMLNFTKVIYINSTGIALIVSLIARARKAGQRLLVSGLSDHYREIFEVTRLSDLVTIVADEAGAHSHG